MGAKINDQAIVDVQPLGVMAHGFGHDGAAGHKAERVNEIVELEFAMKLPVHNLPPLQLTQCEQDFVLGEFGGHWPNDTSREAGCLCPPSRLPRRRARSLKEWPCQKSSI